MERKVVYVRPKKRFFSLNFNLEEIYGDKLAQKLRFHAMAIAQGSDRTWFEFESTKDHFIVF